MALLHKIVSTSALTAILATSGTVAAADLSGVPSGSYVLDPTHAYINFQYNHLGLSNPTLNFDDFTVDLNLDNENPTKSMISVSIDSASVQSGSSIFDEHLAGGDFFDVSNHPEITFQSTNIEAKRDGAYTVTGDLTIKGVTKSLALDVTINAAMMHPMSGKPVIGLDASGMVLRSDFGMDKAVPHVSDEVTLNITTELSKSE